jgi:hypothetical protein
MTTSSSSVAAPKKHRAKATKNGEEEDSIWPPFVDWLVATKGVARATAHTYAVQTRRILREVEPLTSEALEEWSSKMEAYMRTPFRSSWRSYLAFIKATYGTSIPDFQTREEGDVPSAIISALCECHKIGLSSGDLESIGVELETGPRFRALCEINRSVAEGTTMLVLRPANQTLALVPKSIYETLRGWGGETAWLVPSYPGSKRPMPSVKITRLVKRHARTAPLPQPQ